MGFGTSEFRAALKRGSPLLPAMTYPVYNLALSLAAPVGAAWLALRPRYRPLLRRFSPPLPSLADRPIWVQACSVGEVVTAQTIIAAIRARWPEIPVVLTTSTAAGHDVAQTKPLDANVTWFPFDHPLVVRHFVQRLNPRLLVLLETEVWPNILRETRRHGVPVVVLNGRLSDKYYRRYHRFRALLRPVFRHISLAGMQNAEYADRLSALGVAQTDIRITGNTKLDGVATAVSEEVRARLREENGFHCDSPILLFGSTRPGDETLAAACWLRLKEPVPRLSLVVAPRHSDRAEVVASLFGEPVLRRSEVLQGRKRTSERIFLLDTIGELGTFYGIATVAVVGGSFFPGMYGHNPIEPAALGVPTVFGPYMRNFADLARVLTEEGGARQITEIGELAGVLEELLRDEAKRKSMGARGRAAVLANQGATQRSLDLLSTVLT